MRADNGERMNHVPIPDDPKEKGEDAFLRRSVDDRSANPYERGTSEHRQWDEGFCSGWWRHYGKRYGKTYEEFWP